ncbi:hypothetical protein PENSPDRAFT_751889 [Peniophora sp. CONT]|nr:hypothetical protein PENSPDRAFT_751889 [Peniophora sp. CONT]
MPPNTTVGYQTIYTDKDKFLRNDEASKLHNEGKRLQRAHNYAAAEQCYLRAIAIRDELWGMGSTQAAVNQVALAEMYVEMGKLDEAEWTFQHVLEVYDQHQALRDHFDAAAVRESLAQVYEAKGDGREARRVRARGLPNHLACGNYKCPGAMFTIKAVQRCSHCKCIMYCTPVCQNADWKRHKKYCKEVARSLGIDP